MIDTFVPPAPAETPEPPVSRAEESRRLMSAKTQELYGLLRELRQGADLSLTQAEAKFGFPAEVIGAYERGDRNPNVDKLNALLNGYGWELVAVPRGATVVPPTGADAQPRVWTTPTLADTLRSISAHIDAVLAQRTPAVPGGRDRG